MLFPESTVFIISAVMTVVLCEAIWFASYRWYNNYLLRMQKSLNTTAKSALFPILMTVVLAGGLTWLLLHHNLIDVKSAVIMLALFILLLPVQLNLSQKMLKEKSAKSETGGREVTPFGVYSFNYILLFIMLSPLVYLGISQSVKAIAPRIAVVAFGDKGYSSGVSYGWQKGRELSLTDDYLDNRTSDTLFRVTVLYAIPGKDSCNYYKITGVFPPETFKRMRGPVDFYMRRIPPFRKWSVTKFGDKYRRQTIFIVNRRQLDLFINQDLYPIGLKPNLRIDSIREHSRSLWEDTVMNRKLENMVEDYLMKHLH